MITTAEASLYENVPHVHYAEDGLLGSRPAARYNAAEQAYSALLYTRIEQLLRGERNLLILLRKYPAEPRRLGTMPTPETLERQALRVPIIEKLAMDALVFLSDHSTGGPVAQQVDGAGRLVETRKFPTRFPHIIIERVDTYANGVGTNGASEAAPESVEWSARRVQNQRTSTRINRMLDAANLTIDVVKLILP